MVRSLPVAALAVGLLVSSASAQQVEAETFILDNGMKFLLVPRTDQPNVIAAGWVAKVGSVNERPGITGISHFFEHMMFKGTTTIGTADPQKDQSFTDRQKAVKDKINAAIWTSQYQRYYNGEISDPWDPANDTDEIKALRGELKKLMDEHREQAIVKDEFDKVYTQMGGSGMNAFTNYDVTFYFINIPSNKFELWAWMESDRLSDSVFREFYSERDVVHEERRLRTESTPTGIYEEEFEALFWQSSPYSWPVIGWPSDLNSYTIEEAKRYWDIYYQPTNLVGVIVGDFKPADVKEDITRYFSRLSKGTQAPPPVVTLEIPQKAEKRMYAECECQPQVEVRYHTVPHNHADSFPLEIMGELLNGRTGRLYKSLVEGKSIASSAGAGNDNRKYGGAFSFYAEVKGEATPEQLEQAWYEELKKLQTEPVTDRELQKVKNQVAADSYRRLQNNYFLMVQLGILEAYGDWEYINESPKKLQAVTAADIQRVAQKYFDKHNRCVAIYTRKAGSEADASLAGLNPQFLAVVNTVKGRLAKATAQDLPRIKEAIVGMQQRRGEAAAEEQQLIDIIIKAHEDRVAELEAAGK